MPAIPLRPPPHHRNTSTPCPLPSLLQTPTGLAILELQGTIHFPSPPSSTSLPLDPRAKKQKLSPLDPSFPSDDASKAVARDSPREGTRVGHLEFPLYDFSKGPEEQGEAWMKKVYFYVGSHQRMMGEVRRLGRPVAVIRRREGRGGLEGQGGAEGMGARGEGETQGAKEELEIVEIVKYKIVFAARPEPVGGMEEG
ncbi:hypothetical protein KVT40_005313 [Elsinoe batatas]|uniref:Ctf8-domain-containing protein n=1 Tax=Elsinoe batatas TaxID=2601811 RepID=A0A8K0PGH3_9PEZI|nr:hypothetical protein KVT40_005313 [Elsinoe batatas]